MIPTIEIDTSRKLEWNLTEWIELNTKGKTVMIINNPENNKMIITSE